jgi:hypothetical protein
MPIGSFASCSVIMGEIQKLRQEHRERHHWAKADTQPERIEQEVKLKALGLLGNIGLTFDALTVWTTNQDGKRR